MEKVEEDLARSKNLREKQAKEFSRQLDDLKIKHEKEVHCCTFLWYCLLLIPIVSESFMVMLFSHRTVLTV